MLSEPSPCNAVLFDLLTGLLDSWSLWNQIAADADSGRRWRLRYLERTYGEEGYRPYETLVEEAAADVDLPSSLAADLVSAWDQLAPWPEVSRVLSSLRGYPLGVVTNCSEQLARRAVQRVGVRFDVVVSAERAGAYKPDPRPYRLALAELGLKPQQVLFVAGSPHDITGASRAGMPVFWHNRLGIFNDAASQAVEVAGTLESLGSRLRAGEKDDGK